MEEAKILSVVTLTCNFITFLKLAHWSFHYLNLLTGRLQLSQFLFLDPFPLQGTKTILLHFLQSPKGTSKFSKFSNWFSVFIINYLLSARQLEVFYFWCLHFFSLYSLRSLLVFYFWIAFCFMILLNNFSLCSRESASIILANFKLLWDWL